MAKDLVAGAYVFVGRHCEIAPKVIIGRYTMLASYVAIIGDDHNWTEPGVPMQFAGRPPQRPTVIGADVWVGRSAVILRGVTIGNGSIIAAGAVVTRDVPPYEIWAGVPAKFIDDRFDGEASRAEHEERIAGPLFRPKFAGPLADYEGNPR